MKDFLFWARVVDRISNMKISRRFADYVKNSTKKRATRAARLFSLIQPITLLICEVVGAAAVVVS